MKNMEQQIPMKRVASPQEIADRVWWLTGSPPAPYITGETVIVAGGSWSDDRAFFVPLLVGSSLRESPFQVSASFAILRPGGAEGRSRPTSLLLLDEMQTRRVARCATP